MNNASAALVMYGQIRVVVRSQHAIFADTDTSRSSTPLRERTALEARSKYCPVLQPGNPKRKGPSLFGTRQIGTCCINTSCPLVSRPPNARYSRDFLMETGQINLQCTLPHTPNTRTPPGIGSVLNVRSYQSSGIFFTNATPSAPPLPPHFENTWTTPISFAPINTPSNTRKRPRALSGNDENIPPTPADNFSSKKAKTSKRRTPRSDKEKMDAVLASIHDQGWTLGEFLYRLFDHQGRDGSRTRTQSQMVSTFLAGHAKFTPSDILAFWMASPDGVLAAHDPNLADIYTASSRRIDVLCLTNCGNPPGACQNPVKKSGWLRIGQDTIPFVGDVLERHLKPAFYLLEQIAKRKPRVRDGVAVAPRKQRPAQGVIIHALADLLYCRTARANLLPLSRGILYFGSSVPVDIMAYNCRIGTMPSYSTVYRHLEALSAEEARVTLTHGSDPTKVGLLLFDNVQNLARVRDHRIGRENHMNVGMSALWVEAWDVINAHVFDLSDKRQRITYNERANLSVDRLFSFLDQEDADTTGHLAWLEVLFRCVKPLKYQSAEVKARLRGTAKLVVPVQKSVVHPLAPSGKKETLPSELKDGLLDFLKQIGQTPENYIPRKLIIGGDGLSYAMVLQLQSYLQWHKDPFKSFEIFEPQLQVWHTKWTDIIRIFQTHWGHTLGKSTNPASLGHSASRIGRAAPSNMKKVEFYPGSQLLYLVLDARMLDCWSLLLGVDDIFEHFDVLSKQNKLPDLEELVTMSKKLHRTYSTARARDHAIHDIGSTTAWAQTVPTGTLWVPIPVEDSSLDTTAKKKKKKSSTTKKKKDKPPAPPCKGDFVLAQAIDFIRDGINSRKLATAVAEGDVGRLYECLKYMLFTFTGSTHSNYGNYLLETIINLELESSPGLREALLMCQIVNLTGLPGHCEEGDYVVEFFNRLVEDITDHKNAQFDDNFIRNVISRNLRHIAELKLAWRASTGMAAKSHIHANPHTKPEMRILLELYRTQELHSRRLGRQIDDRDTDNFAKGVKKLREGTLKKFIDKSVYTRRPRKKTTQPTTSADSEDSDDGAGDGGSSEESDEESDVDPWEFYATRGSMAVVDGELVMDERDMMEGPAEEIVPDVESEDEEAEES
ncbi:hypothetical protein C8R45DRAFT_1078905 [Mycena sanguinolenta]|nr:hypothetical protein C8R45DRAFT_1078905 [Mycena sanguinolenta]